MTEPLINKAIKVLARMTEFKKANACFFNVHNAVLTHGGKMRLGWIKGHAIFSEKPMIQAWIHHAIWEMIDGSLRDITPQIELDESGAFDVLMQTSYFIPDDGATLLPVGDKWQSRSPIYEVLIDNHNVHRGIAYLKAADEKIKSGDLKGEAYWCQRAEQALGGWIKPMGVHVMAPFSLTIAEAKKLTTRIYFEQYGQVWSMSLADAIALARRHGPHDLDRDGGRTSVSVRFAMRPRHSSAFKILCLKISVRNCAGRVPTCSILSVGLKSTTRFGRAANVTAPKLGSINVAFCSASNAEPRRKTQQGKAMKSNNDGLEWLKAKIIEAEGKRAAVYENKLYWLGYIDALESALENLTAIEKRTGKALGGASAS